MEENRKRPQREFLRIPRRFTQLKLVPSQNLQGHLSKDRSLQWLEFVFTKAIRLEKELIVHDWLR